LELKGDVEPALEILNVVFRTQMEKTSESAHLSVLILVLHYSYHTGATRQDKLVWFNTRQEHKDNNDDRRHGNDNNSDKTEKKLRRQETGQENTREQKTRRDETRRETR
jgi:hypothetical protein